jgi:hypothetical protein
MFAFLHEDTIDVVLAWNIAQASVHIRSGHPIREKSRTSVRVIGSTNCSEVGTR